MTEALKNHIPDPTVVGVLVLDDCHTVLKPGSEYSKIMQVCLISFVFLPMFV